MGYDRKIVFLHNILLFEIIFAINNAMIQICYIPSEHPYRAIYYEGRLGLQKGTIIEVEEIFNETGETDVVRSFHPVVTYYNLEQKSKYRTISSPWETIDTDVWYDAEEKDVITIAVENGSIDWHYFLRCLAPKIKKNVELAPPPPCRLQIKYHYTLMKFFASLERMGIKIIPPKEDRIMLDAYLFIYEKDGLRWCGTEDDDETKYECVWDGKDEEDIFYELEEQSTFYSNAGIYLNKTINTNFVAAPDEDEINEVKTSLDRIVKRLSVNQNNELLTVCRDIEDYHDRVEYERLEEIGRLDGVRIRTKDYFHSLDENEQIDFLKGAISLLLTSKTKSDGTRFFCDAIDWIGIYQTITEDLELRLSKSKFYEYAGKITPENFPCKGKIKEKTKTNNSTYTKKEKNPVYYRRTMEVRQAFWDIVWHLAVY